MSSHVFFKKAFPIFSEPLVALHKTHGKEKGTKGDTGKEQTFFSASDGKRQKKTLANVYKILSANRVSNYYEFNLVTSMFSASGALGRMSAEATATAAGAMPVHIVDLTAVPNVTVGGQVVNGASTVGTSVNQMQPYHIEPTCCIHFYTSLFGTR